jgi:4-hydroxy 2-oxovalerate aldolase
VTKRVRIVEATVRDGGYMVDHQFSRTDLAAIVGGLDRAGIQLIEVGHGNGVGSELFKDPKLRATSMPIVDERGHAEVALRVAPHARVGVVLTAGRRFAPIEYIDRIAELGFAFVRLTTMPDEANDELFAYVRRGKDRGLTVSINVMQTYVMTPAGLGEVARKAAAHGTDWLYVVDSAGGMMPDEVKRYVEAVLAASPQLEVGLHAHNNLGCAVANALAAVDAGATLVDGTLNGIGRATGNPATEQLAVALRDRLAHEVDLEVLAALGNAMRSLFEDTGNAPLDYISGGALVHSRNVPAVFAAAHARGRAPNTFLLGVGAEARQRSVLSAMEYTPELYDAVAARSPAVARVEPSSAMVAVARDELLARWHGGPRRILEDLQLRSRQRHAPSVVHVSRAASALCSHAIPWQGVAVGVTVPANESAAWDVPSELLPDYVVTDEGDGAAPLPAKHATWSIAFSDAHKRAVQDLCTSLRSQGFALWCPGGGERWLGGLTHATGTRPTGRVALVLGDDVAGDALLAAGDVGVLAIASPRARIDAARARGAQVLRPRWPDAVSRIVDAVLASRGELAITSRDGLMTGVHAAGGGQLAWDPDYPALLDSDDPNADAARAGDAYLAALLAGVRRL